MVVSEFGFCGYGEMIGNWGSDDEWRYAERGISLTKQGCCVRWGSVAIALCRRFHQDVPGFLGKDRGGVREVERCRRNIIGPASGTAIQLKRTIELQRALRQGTPLGRRGRRGPGCLRWPGEWVQHAAHPSRYEFCCFTTLVARFSLRSQVPFRRHDTC